MNEIDVTKYWTCFDFECEDCVVENCAGCPFNILPEYEATGGHDDKNE